MQKSVTGVRSAKFCRTRIARSLGMGRLAPGVRSGGWDSSIDVQRTRDDVGLVKLIAGELAHDAAVVHDRHAVAAADELVVVGRVEEDRSALVGELAHETVEFLLGADVNAARRI